jgi:hypothetical protein
MMAYRGGAIKSSGYNVRSSTGPRWPGLALEVSDSVAVVSSFDLIARVDLFRALHKTHLQIHGTEQFTIELARAILQ